jgi:hypothetical protein
MTLYQMRGACSLVVLLRVAQKEVDFAGLDELAAPRGLIFKKMGSDPFDKRRSGDFGINKTGLTPIFLPSI